MVLTVRDFGPGVPQEARKRVFERFYRDATGKRDGAGAGLGLATVAEVARIHYEVLVRLDLQVGTFLLADPEGADSFSPP